MLPTTGKPLLVIFLFGVTVSCMGQEPAAPPDVRVERVTVVPDRLRPPVLGPNAGVSAGHPLTTAAAIEVLQDGGNAFDAGVAALLVGGVVEQDLYGLGVTGAIQSAGEEGIRVCTGKDLYRIIRIKPENGRNMTAGEWVRGHPLPPDARFG